MKARTRAYCAAANTIMKYQLDSTDMTSSLSLMFDDDRQMATMRDQLIMIVSNIMETALTVDAVYTNPTQANQRNTLRHAAKEVQSLGIDRNAVPLAKAESSVSPKMKAMQQAASYKPSQPNALSQDEIDSKFPATDFKAGIAGQGRLDLSRFSSGPLRAMMP